MRVKNQTGPVLAYGTQGAQFLHPVLLSPTYFLHFGLKGTDVEPQEGLCFIIQELVFGLSLRPH